MATSVVFNNKLIEETGVYARIQAGVNTPTQDLSFGNILIIDKGKGSDFGGLSGVNGEQFQGKDSAYFFNNPADFRTFVKGGIYWHLAEYLFRPSGGLPGISGLTYIRAASTTPSLITMPLTNGSLEFKTKDEGINSIGVQGDETRASATLTISVLGVATDTIDIVVNDGVSNVTLASYTLDGTETLTSLAATLTELINSSQTSLGYSATSDQATISIKVPFNLGSSANTYTLTSNTTGSLVVTNDPTFSGGVDGTKLTRGYSAVLSAGTIDSSKYKISFYRGNFKGLAPDGISWDELEEKDTNPELVAESEEVDTIEELVEWANSDFDFNSLFSLSNSSVTGLGSFDPNDLINITGNVLASGGTETYSSSDFDTVLDSINDLDFTFILAEDNEDNSQSVDNIKIQSWLLTESRFDRYMFVGAQSNRINFNNGSLSSISTAQFYNDQRVIPIHGGIKRNSTLTGTGFREFTSLHAAAVVLGRMCGLEPQTPANLKSLGVSGVLHDLNDDERRLAIRNGVGFIKFDTDLNFYVLGEQINSLQFPKNKALVNSDGTSHIISIERIKAQLNKEILINAKVQLLAKEDGPNFNTLSPEDVKQWLEGYLKSKTATETDDNLILSSQNITVQQEQDVYKVNYEFVPNYPVRILLFTGFALDANLTA